MTTNKFKNRKFLIVVMILLIVIASLFAFRRKIKEIIYFATDKNLRTYYFHFNRKKWDTKIVDGSAFKKGSLIYLIPYKDSIDYIILSIKNKNLVFKKFYGKIDSKSFDESWEWILQYNLMSNRAFSLLKDSIMNWNKFQEKVNKLEKYYFVLGINDSRKKIEFLVVADTSNIDRIIHYEFKDSISLKGNDYYLDKTFPSTK